MPFHRGARSRPGRVPVGARDADRNDQVNAAGAFGFVFRTGVAAQGQRTLSPLCGKDLQQEVVTPAGDLAFAFDASF
jgi:hypothetical protein